MRRVLLFGKPINEKRAYLIAEAGVNHNGDMSRAREMVRVAGESGADCVKFQAFDADSLARPDAPFADYQKGQAESQHSMLASLTLRPEDFEELQAMAADLEIDFLATPFSVDQARFLVETMQLDTVKVGSGDLTFSPMLRYLAGARVTVILSTGMATVSEIKAALDDLDGTDTVLLHCVSQYPAPPHEANLKAIQELRSLTGDPVGFSDHFLEDHLSPAARALGAVVLERHFTLDKNLPGPDHKASMDPVELQSWVDRIREVEQALGSGVKSPMPSETNTREVARRSLVAARHLDKGHEIEFDDLTALRPADGISPQLIDQIVGRRTTRPVKRGQLLTWELLKGGRPT